jgi:tetratricopeptide (TPR) repeat protein
MNGAIQEYQAAVELTSDPGLLAQTYANLGAAYRAIGQTADAQDNYNHALRLNPNLFNAWMGLGLIAQKQGNLAEAITDLSRSIELQPNARAYVALGHAMAQSGRNAEARAAYEQALTLSPDLTEARRAADALPPQP